MASNSTSRHTRRRASLGRSRSLDQWCVVARRVIAVAGMLLAFASTTAAGAGTGAEAEGSGIGVSPVELEFQQTLRGGTYARTLMLRNTDPERSAEFTASIEGDAGGWLTLSDEDGWTVTTDGDDTAIVVLPATTAHVTVTVTVPDDAANGEYTAAVEVVGKTVTEVDQDGGGAGAGVELAGLVPVTINVSGTQNYDARAVDFVVDPAEVGMPQRFNATVVNNGNVQVLPELEVTISRDGAIVDQLSSAGEAFPVDPETTGRVYVEWDTTEQRAGEYIAEFAVVDVAGSTRVDLGDRTRSFRLEPFGTFSRSATFDSLRLREVPDVGGIAVIRATFTNTGQIETTGVLAGELYLDGDLVEVTTSLGRLARAGETTSIDTSIEIDAPGHYRFVATLNHDGRVTEPRELEFTVQEAGQEGSDDDAVGGAAGNVGDDGTGGVMWLALAMAVIGVPIGLMVVRRFGRAGQRGGAVIGR